MNTSGPIGESLSMHDKVIEHHTAALKTASKAMSQLIVGGNKLAKGENIILDPEHVGQVAEHYLPDWHHTEASAGGKKYQLIRRTLRNSPLISFAHLQSKHRIIGLRGHVLTMMVQDISTDDLAAAVDIEKQIVTDSAPPIELLDKIKEHDQQAFRLAETGDDLEAIDLTPHEQRIAESLLLPTSQVAAKYKIKESTARTHLKNTKQKFEVKSTVALLIELVRHGQIDISDIPKGATDCLTPMQKRLLSECYDLTYDDAAKHCGISDSTIRSHWHAIFVRTKTNRKLDAVAVGLRDGLIK